MQSYRDELIKDLNVLEDGMQRVSENSEIWQNQLVYWLCKSVKDVINYILLRG